MTRYIAIFGALILTTGGALAQPAAGPDMNDPAFLQRAVAAVQVQRNAAQDAAAVAEARAATLTQELAKAKTRIEELEKERK